MSHRNARLNARGRQLLVERVCEQGWAVAHAAKAQGVSRQCAHRWITRFRKEGWPGLHDRSSRPRHTPRQTPAETEKAIVALRVQQRRGQDWIGPEMSVPARTVSRVLRRHRVPYLRDCDPLTGEVIRSMSMSRRSARSPTAEDGKPTAVTWAHHGARSEPESATTTCTR